MPIVITYDPVAAAMQTAQAGGQAQAQYAYQNQNNALQQQLAAEQDRKNQLAEQQRQFNATLQNRQAEADMQRQFENNRLQQQIGLQRDWRVGLKQDQMQAMQQQKQQQMALLDQQHAMGTISDRDYAAAQQSILGGDRSPLTQGINPLAQSHMDLSQQRFQYEQQQGQQLQQQRVAQAKLNQAKANFDALQKTYARPTSPEYQAAQQAVQDAYGELQSSFTNSQPGNAPGVQGAGQVQQTAPQTPPGQSAKPTPQSIADQALQQSNYDPAKARALLAAHGFDPNNVIVGQ